MIRLTSYSSEDSLILRDLGQCQKKSPSKRLLKYVTTNEYENILVLQNVTFDSNLVNVLYNKLRQNVCNGRYMPIGNKISDKQKLSTFVVDVQMRKEYYNDIDICLKDYGQLDIKKVDDIREDEASLSTTYEDYLDSTVSPKWSREYEYPEINTKNVDVLSSNESTLFLDAIDVDYDIKTQQDSDEDTMKSITKTSTSRISLESIALPQGDELQEQNLARLETKTSRAMTVMTKDILNDGDWGKEREVLILRDENKSFGISIVGGTVNVSDDTVVSGIFIKNIIPNSPADSCGLLKVGDRILAVDGIDVSQSSHEHAVKTIKNADSKMILQVQSLVKKIDECTETSTLLKKVPPPITPCKTPELELIHEGTEVSSNVIKEQESNEQQFTTENINTDTIKLPIPVTSVSQQQPDTDSDNSSDDEDVRDLEGKIYTKAGVEIDRASAGNIKMTKEEIALDTEEEDCFGYTAKKIKKRYGTLGQVLHHSVERSSSGALGISLAGHRDRTKMACFIAGINPKGSASAVPFAIGDEILEVNGIVLHGRSHLNVPTIIKGLVGSSVKFIVLRRTSATEDLAVKPVTQFPVCIDEEEELFSAYKNVRVVSIKKTGAVIIDILPNSVACKDKRLQVFDQVLEINGTKISLDLSEKQIQKAVKQLLPKVRLVIFRPNTAETEKVEIELFKKPGRLLGLGFRANHPNGIVVTDMLSGGIAESDGRIQKGDIISNLNSESISNMSFEDCSALLKTAQGKMTFTILRPKPKKRLL